MITVQYYCARYQRSWAIRNWEAILMQTLARQSLTQNRTKWCFNICSALCTNENFQFKVECTLPLHGFVATWAAATHKCCVYAMTLCCSTFYPSISSSLAPYVCNMQELTSGRVSYGIQDSLRPTTSETRHFLKLWSYWRETNELWCRRCYDTSRQNDSLVDRFSRGCQWCCEISCPYEEEAMQVLSLTDLSMEGKTSKSSLSGRRTWKLRPEALPIG